VEVAGAARLGAPDEEEPAGPAGDTELRRESALPGIAWQAGNWGVCGCGNVGGSSKLQSFKGRRICGQELKMALLAYSSTFFSMINLSIVIR
jgi:hypothetical protein